MNRNIKLCLTGACGKLAYSLYIPLCSGMILGANVSIDLRLVDVFDKQDQLKIIQEQLTQCCFKNVNRISIYDERDKEKPFEDVDLAIFLGGMPRKPGMQKKEVFQINAQIFQTQGRYLEKAAKATCKSLVIANPSCTNCMILANNAPKIQKQNFTSLTRLDYNRFLVSISNHFNCEPKQIKNLILWGNHSRKKFLDASMIQVNNISHQLVLQKLKSHDLKQIQKVIYERGRYILQNSNGNCYISATTAIIDHLKDWLLGSDKIVSMGVYLTKQIYGIPAGICFSLPTRCLGDGKYEIISNIELSQIQKCKILQNKQQLLKQKAIVQQFNQIDNQF